MWQPRTSDLRELRFPVYDRGPNRWVPANDPSGHGKRRLKERRGRDVGSGQFVNETISIRVNAQSKSFFRLHAVVVVEGVVGELAK